MKLIKDNNTHPGILQFILIPLIIGLFSILEVFSASRFRAMEYTGNPYYFIILHIIWLTLAAVAGIIVYKIPFTPNFHIGKMLYYISIVLLVLVFFAPSYNGSHRWFQLGSFTTLQPSEFVKITLIIFMATYLATQYKKVRLVKNNYSEHLKKQLLPILIWIGLPIFLIFIEPDLSTAGVIGIVLMSMFLFANKRFWKKDLLLGLFLLVTVFILGIAVQGYRSNRLQVYVHLLQTGEVEDKYGKGYQLYNILLGIGSGGLWGKGIGQSRQKEGYLLETTAFTDSIAAVAFEELGFVLSTVFIFLYFYYFYIIIRRAMTINNPIHAYILWGGAHLILLQALIHFSANLGLIPITGIALPFMTYGGSSLLVMGIMVGLITKLAKDQGAVKKVIKRRISSR